MIRGRIRSVSTLSHWQLAATILGLFLLVHFVENLLGSSPIGSLPRVVFIVGEAGFVFVLAVYISSLVRSRDSTRRNADLIRELAQEVVDNVPDGLLIVDKEGRIVHSNVGLMRICGLSPVAVTPARIDDLGLRNLDGEPLEIVPGEFLRARVGPWSRLVDVEVIQKRLPGESGLQLIAVRDITPTLRAMIELESRQEDLRVLAELARALNRVEDPATLVNTALETISKIFPIFNSGGVFLVDRESKNLRLFGHYGLPEEFVAAEQTIELGECLCGQVALSGQTLFSPSCFGDPMHSRHRQGSPHGHLIVPLCDEASVIGVLFTYLAENAEISGNHDQLLHGIASEIGLALARSVDRQALHDSEQQLEEQFLSAPDAIIVVTRDAEVLRVNLQGRRWFESGLSTSDLLPWEEILKSLEGQDNPVRAEIPTRNNRRAIVEITASEIRPAGNVQLILRDVTREAMLERKTDQFQKMEAIGLLAAGLAHDLNNSISTVLAQLDSMAHNIESSETVNLPQNVKELRDATEHISAMVGQLLEFARPGSQQIKHVELSQLVERQLALLTPILDRQGITVAPTIQPSVAVFADRSILINSFINLVFNAADATTAGGVIEVVLRQGTSGKVHLSIRDSGDGMESETLERIFEPFFTTKKDGSGLGLPMVRVGISSLGGEIYARSTPGRGSIFEIIMPGADDPTEQANLEANRILVAEDEPLLLNSLTRYLELRGWSVRGVQSVAEAENLIQDWSPDVALVDWNLGDCVSLDLIGPARAAGALVIVMTGDPEAVSIGDVPKIGKPISWDEFRAILLQSNFPRHDGSINPTLE